jgi:ferric-dicitrate binding protein FerR (iron transport regulator)
MLRDLSTVDAKLQELAAANPATLRLLAAPVVSPAQAARRPAWFGWLAWAAAVIGLLVAGGIVFRQGTGDPSLTMLGRPKGVVVERGSEMLETEAAGAIRVGDVVRTPPGAPLVAGYRDGTQVELSGGGSLACEAAGSDGKSLFLHDGQLTVFAAKQPKNRPMVVRTPQAEVTVVGTKFVLRSRDGITRVEVTEGEVLLRGLQDEDAVRVRQGESKAIGGERSLAERLEVPAHGTARSPVLLLKLGKAPVVGAELDASVRIGRGKVTAHSGDDYVSEAVDETVVAHKGFGTWSADFRFTLETPPVPGSYVFGARWMQGGDFKVCAQTFEVWAGPSADALTRRGIIRLSFAKAWQRAWKTKAGVTLRADDAVLEVRNRGAGHDAKVFSAFLLAPQP